MTGNEGSGDPSGKGGNNGGAGRGLGPRDAQPNSSILYSLDALTTSAPKLDHNDSDDAPQSSGTIDLGKLAKMSKAAAAPAVLDAQPVFGAPEAPAAQLEPAKPKSRMGMGIGIGIAVAGLAVAAAFVYSSQNAAPATAPSGAAPSVAAVASSVAVSPAIAPASATASESAPAASASAAPPAVAGKGPFKKPASGATTAPVETPAEPEPTPAPTPTVKAPPPSPCGCAPSDLKCNMDCAIKGPKK